MAALRRQENIAAPEVPGDHAAPHADALRRGGGKSKRLDRPFAKHVRHRVLAPTVAGTAMLNVSGTTRVLVATTPVDLRGNFNRLYGLVVDQLKGDPLSGNLFLFTNRRRNRIKILAWDGSGIWICAKRLESGRFTFPVSEQGQISLRGEDFNALIHGLEVRSKKDWYRR